MSTPEPGPAPWFRHLDRPTAGSGGAVPGTPWAGPAGAGTVAAPQAIAPRDGRSTVGAVLGSLGLLLAVFGVGLPLALAGAVLGWLGVRRARRGRLRPTPASTTALVTGLAGTVIAGVAIGMVVASYGPQLREFLHCATSANTPAQLQQCRDILRDIPTGSG